MAHSRQRDKGRRNGHTFTRFFKHMTGHPKFCALSHVAKALLIELGHQYNGSNNGDLCLALSVLKQRGWTSNDVITRAKTELLEAGFILLARQGGRNIPSLYAITWESINSCKGKVDIPETKAAPNSWKSPRLKIIEQKNKSLHRKAVQLAPSDGTAESKKEVS